MSERVSLSDLLKNPGKKKQNQEDSQVNPDNEPKYDENFPVTDYQRYFEYKNQNEGIQKKPVGICRKCKTSISRKDGNTSGLLKHIKSCDPTAWEELNKRKTTSVSSPSRKKSTNQPINEFFQVKIICYPNYFINL